MQKKQNLAGAFYIQKENWGYNHTFFRDNEAPIRKKKPYISLYFTTFFDEEDENLN